MEKKRKKQDGIPAFYAKIVDNLLIVETNERTLPLFGTETVKLPRELKFAFCKKSKACAELEKPCEPCAELKSEFSYVYLTTTKKSLRGKPMTSLFCATILLEIREGEVSPGKNYLYNVG